MKKLLYTTTAFVLCGGIVQANAACIATPSCYDMGYSSTSSCDGGLKCPFGSYWYCPSNSGGECADFPYTCFGAGYVDGIGDVCEGKYSKCICTDEYEWIDGKGCVGKCDIGSILFSDKTCSMYMRTGRTAIAVVVYVNDAGGGQAMALKSLDTNYMWSTEDVDITSLTNYMSSSAASQDYDSCGNTAIILAAGDKSKYPAAWAAHEYSTEGTSAGDWCLPAAGIFTSYYNNKSVINTGFSRAGGTKFTSGTYARSSSETGSGSAWGSYFNRSYGLSSYGKTGSHEVRPVIEF